MIRRPPRSTRTDTLFPYTALFRSAIYNVFGAGSDGRPIDHMIGYSTSKRAVQFLTQPLVGEVRGLPVLVGAISPGLVMTDGFLREHARLPHGPRSEEHTSELQSLMRISYAVFCLKKNKSYTSNNRT